MKLTALFPVIFPKRSTQEQLVLSCLLLSRESWQQPRKWVTLWVNRHFLFMGCHGKGWRQGWKTWEWLISELMRCPPCFTNLRFLEITNQALPKYISVCTYIHTHTHLFVFIQLILIIHRCHIFEFAYVLKCLCNPHISTHSTSTVFVDMCRVVKKSPLPVEINRGNTAFLFQLCLSTSVLFAICLVPCSLHSCDFTL